jgi:hypothetical protein
MLIIAFLAGLLAIGEPAWSREVPVDGGLLEVSLERTALPLHAAAVIDLTMTSTKSLSLQAAIEGLPETGFRPPRLEPLGVDRVAGRTLQRLRVHLEPIAPGRHRPGTLRITLAGAAPGTEPIRVELPELIIDDTGASAADALDLRPLPPEIAGPSAGSADSTRRIVGSIALVILSAIALWILRRLIVGDKRPATASDPWGDLAANLVRRHGSPRGWLSELRLRLIERHDLARLGRLTGPELLELAALGESAETRRAVWRSLIELTDDRRFARAEPTWPECEEAWRHAEALRPPGPSPQAG